VYTTTRLFLRGLIYTKHDVFGNLLLLYQHFQHPNLRCPARRIFIIQPSTLIICMGMQYGMQNF
jgi:hypothetical protein